MNTLELVGADDDVGEGGTVLKDEDGVVGTSVIVSVAGTTTVKLLVAVVIGAGDDRGFGEGDDAAAARRDVEGLGRAQGRDGGEEDGARSLHGDGGEGGNGGWLSLQIWGRGNGSSTGKRLGFYILLARPLLLRSSSASVMSSVMSPPLTRGGTSSIFALPGNVSTLAPGKRLSTNRMTGTGVIRVGSPDPILTGVFPREQRE